jgi:hypothetical protein
MLPKLVQRPSVSGQELELISAGNRAPSRDGG